MPAESISDLRCGAQAAWIKYGVPTAIPTAIKLRSVSTTDALCLGLNSARRRGISTPVVSARVLNLMAVTVCQRIEGALYSPGRETIGHGARGEFQGSDV